METTLLTGTVQSGGTNDTQPLDNVFVTLYVATAGTPAVIGEAKTDAAGNFSVSPSRTTSESIFYAAATFDGGVKLVTVIGPNLPASITINELTTVAAAFSCAQFTQDGVITGDAFALRIASGMNDNLLNPLMGDSSEVLLSSPNGDETNSLRSTRALANLLVPSVRRQPGAISTLFALTTPPGGDAPSDTFQALVNIARYPTNNVGDIYTQSGAAAPQAYQPSLVRPPDAWTIAVKVNNSGSDDYPFGGPANLVFDNKGYAWITNNVVQGTPHSTTAGVIVLKPNGQPSDGADSTPVSPLTHGGLLGPGFGIDFGLGRDGKENIWVGNFGWGGTCYQPSPDGNGSVSKFDAHGHPLSGDEGYQGGTDRVQGLALDGYSNVWLASYGNNKLVTFFGGDPESTISTGDVGGGICPFGVAIDHTVDNPTAWVTFSGNADNQGSSRLCKFTINGNDKFQQLLSVGVGVSLKGIAVDSKGNIWAASGGESAVYLFNSAGQQLGKYGSSANNPWGGVSSPWSVRVDGDDNVWVANFGPPESDYAHAGVSKLAEITPPPGYETGDPISPETGYTLHSAGSQVLLHDGTPLYGAGKHHPCFSPLMRQTSCNIDRAGNLWVMNNWKPDWETDTAPGGDKDNANPGGDGIVIFVGLAKPPVTRP